MLLKRIFSFESFWWSITSSFSRFWYFSFCDQIWPVFLCFSSILLWYTSLRCSKLFSCKKLWSSFHTLFPASSFRLCDVLRLCRGNNNLTFLSCHCPYIFTYFLNFVIEGFLFLEIAHLVFVRLSLKLSSCLLCHLLPLFPDLLHNL